MSSNTQHNAQQATATTANKGKSNNKGKVKDGSKQHVKAGS
jgi:hypothetical protein